MAFHSESPEPGISTSNVQLEFGVGFWKALARASHRTRDVPIVKVVDAGRTFLVIDQDDFAELRTRWRRPTTRVDEHEEGPE